MNNSHIIQAYTNRQINICRRAHIHKDIRSTDIPIFLPLFIHKLCQTVERKENAESPRTTRREKDKFIAADSTSRIPIRMKCRVLWYYKPK
jgi:hypothetical protein